MKKLSVMLCFSLLIFLFSCKTLEGEIKKRAQDLGWNKDQAEIAFAIGLRHLMGEELSEKKGTFKSNNRRIKVDDVLKTINQDLKDLDLMLDPADKESRRYLEVNNLKEEFERERLIRKLIRDRLQLISLNNKFYELMGLARPHDNYHDNYQGGASYSLKFLISDSELKKYDFVAKMEELKKEKKFRETQKIFHFIADEMAYKISDPNFPDDPNRFLWKKVRRGLEIKTYTVASENSADNSGEYVEATRIEIKKKENDAAAAEILKRESKPALMIFSGSNRKLNAAVIDTDFEGAYGFGMPDEIIELFNVKNGYDLLKNEGLIALLFKEKERKPPEFVKKDAGIEIVRAGENPIEEWETNINGWQTGIKYKDQIAGNYAVKVVYEDKKGDLRPPHHYSVKKKIEAITKVYLIPGTNEPVNGGVIEYYKPAPPYEKEDIVDVEVNGKKITVYREGIPAVSGIISVEKNTFIENRFFRIDFTEGGQRWRLEDKDNNGVFESRKKIS